MDRLFDLVFVRPPSDSYHRCISSNPAKNDIDIGLAKKQHRDYVSILRESGVKVIELQPLDEFPDSVFMQDPALLGSRITVIGRFGEERRRGEEEVLLAELRNRNDKIGKIESIRAPGTVEGGDVLVTKREIFIGESKRTNGRGIRQLTEHLGTFKVSAVKTSLLHLLCGCTYLNRRTILLAPDLVNPESFPGYDFVLVPKEEAYASDALYLGGGKVLVPYGYSRTRLKLERAGYNAIEAEMSEFWKGDGGVTCLSSPIYRML
jgi:dimethylargininase